MALRVAIIGTGHLGTYHCEKMHQIPQVDLVAVCDTNMEKAQNLGHKYSCQALTNYQDLVSNQGSRVDAVVIAVPTSIHFQVAQFFIKKSISVLVEKPLCRTLEEARWLCEWASSASCILQVGHVERFNPAFKSVKSRLQEALFIETRRWTSFRPRSLDVDVVSDLMVHDLDLVLSLAESSVKSIWATGSAFRSSHLDQAWASIEFNSGLCAHLGVSRVSPVPRRSLEVFKKDESFLLDLAHSKVQWTPPRVQGSPPPDFIREGVFIPRGSGGERSSCSPWRCT